MESQAFDGSVVACPVQCINTFNLKKKQNITPLKATQLSRVSHRIVLVTDAAASQQRNNSHVTNCCTKCHHRCKQWGKNGTDQTHARTHARARTQLASCSHYRAKEKTKRGLHVFGVQGNRGVLDLSRFASQNFRFVSEDLEN